MSLDIKSATILSPTENSLELVNSDGKNNTTDNDYTSNYYIREVNNSNLSPVGLIETDYRCFQKFEIIAEISHCPLDGSGLIFCW